MCVREVPGSSFGHDAGYKDVSWFYIVHPDEFRDSSFGFIDILFSALFTIIQPFDAMMSELGTELFSELYVNKFK